MAIEPRREGVIIGAMRLMSLNLLLLSVALLISACGKGPEQGEQPVYSQKDYPNLESQLFQLATDKNPEKFAYTHNLKYKDGLVQVEIELVPEQALPAGYTIQVEAQYENLIQARVAVKDLLKLSKEPQIKFIRAPMEVQPG